MPKVKPTKKKIKVPGQIDDDSPNLLEFWAKYRVRVAVSKGAIFEDIVEEITKDITQGIEQQVRGKITVKIPVGDPRVIGDSPPASSSDDDDDMEDDEDSDEEEEDEEEESEEEDDEQTSYRVEYRLDTIVNKSIRETSRTPTDDEIRAYLLDNPGYSTARLSPEKVKFSPYGIKKSFTGKNLTVCVRKYLRFKLNRKKMDTNEHPVETALRDIK